VSRVLVGDFRYQRGRALVRPTSRRRCRCCGRRATHVGTANGIALITGCDWLTRRWVKDPLGVYTRKRNPAAKGGGR
jgi:hypothetical protein